MEPRRFAVDDGRPGHHHRDSVGLDTGTAFLPAAADAATMSATFATTPPALSPNSPTGSGCS